jgi:hypothetical protein
MDTWRGAERCSEICDVPVREILLAALQLALRYRRRRIECMVVIGATADLNGRVASANSVEFDPKLPFDDQFCCDAQQRSGSTVW